MGSQGKRARRGTVKRPLRSTCERCLGYFSADSRDDSTLDLYRKLSKKGYNLVTKISATVHTDF